MVHRRACAAEEALQMTAGVAWKRVLIWNAFKLVLHYYPAPGADWLFALLQILSLTYVFCDRQFWLSRVTASHLRVKLFG